VSLKNHIVSSSINPFMFTSWEAIIVGDYITTFWNFLAKNLLHSLNIISICICLFFTLNHYPFLLVRGACCPFILLVRRALHQMCLKQMIFRKCLIVLPRKLAHGRVERPSLWHKRHVYLKTSWCRDL
jgi:hypothetical protein